MGLRNPTIVIKDLSRSFGQQIAVDSLSLDIGAGEIFGLIGPNGAGKSTTIKMLVTLLRPSRGNAWIGGFDILSAPREVRRRIGYVPQFLSADSSLTAFENLKLSARLYGLVGSDRESRIQSAIDLMGLKDVAHHLVKTYSGGMIRRLELAQAMLHNPVALFLDEPTIGLDPVARHVVWDRLKQIRKEFGTTVLLTTHDMEEVEQLCDHISILQEGRLAAAGSAQELKASVGPHATMDDVFRHFSTTKTDDEGGYQNARKTRATAIRLG